MVWFRSGKTTLVAAAGFLGVAAGAPSAEAQPFIERLALRFEAGAGAMLSPYQRNDNPGDQQYLGNAYGYGLALQGTGRLALTLADPLVLQISVADWVFPSGRTDNPGWVFMPTLGLRIEPMVGSVGRFFVDANAGVAFTGPLQRFGFDVGLGFEFQLSRVVGLGPVVRYGQVVQPKSHDGIAELFPDDARYITAGLSLAFRVPHREELPPPVPAVITDTDGDGVMDPDDLCVTVPQGDHPDPHRRGCPTPDSDHDGVLDDTDQCVDTPAGPHPDPTRPGCPDGDRDGDGVLDHQDQCPDVPQGIHPDPTRPGCPDGDRDHDGIPDHSDRCPDQPETYNGIEDEDGCPEANARSLVDIVGSEIRIMGEPINFATNSDRIVGRHSFEVLDALVSILRNHSSIRRVDIQGHTDNRGNRDFNQALSERRATAVKVYLTDHGIVADRMETHGYGLDRPVRSNATAAGRAANRRVEFHIIGMEGAEAPGAHPPAPAGHPH